MNFFISPQARGAPERHTAEEAMTSHEQRSNPRTLDITVAQKIKNKKKHKVYVTKRAASRTKFEQPSAETLKCLLTENAIKTQQEEDVQSAGSRDHSTHCRLKTLTHLCHDEKNK